MFTTEHVKNATEKLASVQIKFLPKVGNKTYSTNLSCFFFAFSDH